MLLISSLEHGGAERQVVELANGLDPDLFQVSVCSLSRLVPLADALHHRNQRLHIITKRWRYDVGLVARVARLMRRLRIQISHAFLHDAEIVARLAARLSGVPLVVASERNTDYRRTLLQSACLRMTRPFFDVVIANSDAGKRFNIKSLGLPASRIYVVHNGVDVDCFCPGDRAAIRGELGIAQGEPVVGMIARFKRQKRHEDFFRMAESVLRRFPTAWFLCVGEPLRDNQQGSEAYYREVRHVLTSLGIEHRCRFLGNRDDMPRMYRACDVTVLTSSREGTPNVLLESMACGTPVVATDISDNRHIVSDGRTGFIVPLGDVDTMASRVTQLLASPALRAKIGREARTWAQSEFSIGAMVQKTATVYSTWLARKAAR